MALAAAGRSLTLTHNFRLLSQELPSSTWADSAKGWWNEQVYAAYHRLVIDERPLIPRLSNTKGSDS
jgi:hypothetical protein